MHRRTVGSSSCSSAVEGFRPTNMTVGSFGFQTRQREYRWVRHGEKAAERSMGPVLIVLERNSSGSFPLLQPNLSPQAWSRREKVGCSEHSQCTEEAADLASVFD